MPTKANVTSVEALEDFRSALVIYLSKAKPTVEEVSSDVIRLRQWLENDKRVFWEGQVKRRLKKLEEAKQAVFSAQLSNLRETSAAEIAAVNKAQRELAEAEAKLNNVKKWARNFESQMQPLVRQTERLHTMLANDLPHAISSLNQIIKTLQDYANVSPASAPPSIESREEKKDGALGESAADSSSTSGENSGEKK